MGDMKVVNNIDLSISSLTIYMHKTHQPKGGAILISSLTEITF